MFPLVKVGTISHKERMGRTGGEATEVSADYVTNHGSNSLKTSSQVSDEETTNH